MLRLSIPYKRAIPIHVRVVTIEIHLEASRVDIFDQLIMYFPKILYSPNSLYRQPIQSNEMKEELLRYNATEICHFENGEGFATLLEGVRRF